MKKKTKNVEKRLNIIWYTLIRKSNRKTAYLANMLSIYSHTPIIFDNTSAESLAGLFLGMYYPESDPKRQQTFDVWGSKAARLRLYMSSSMQSEFICWKGETIASGSEKYYEIIEKAMRAKFEQNEKAKQALISVHGVELTNKETNTEGKFKISPEIFCGILTKLCNEFVQKANSNFFHKKS